MILINLMLSVIIVNVNRLDGDLLKDKDTSLELKIAISECCQFENFFMKTRINWM